MSKTNCFLDSEVFDILGNTFLILSICSAKEKELFFVPYKLTFLTPGIPNALTFHCGTTTPPAVSSAINFSCWFKAVNHFVLLKQLVYFFETNFYL